MKRGATKEEIIRTTQDLITRKQAQAGQSGLQGQRAARGKEKTAAWIEAVRVVKQPFHE